MRFIVRLTVIVITSIVLILTGLLSCDKGNLPPAAQLTVFPAIGDTSILFEFNAGKSTDDRDYPIGLVYRWDLNGDSEWDTEYAKNKSFSKYYKEPGTYLISVEVMDLDGLTSVARDTIEVFGLNPDTDTLYDTRDGNKYLIVKIQNRWWMAGNLRYGIEIPVAREQTDNDTVEMYREHLSSQYDTIGGVYSWFESLKYQVKEQQGICPDGWHIPTKPEWETLIIPYPDLYSLQYYGKQGLSRLDLDLINGAYRWGDGTFRWNSSSAGSIGFWSSSSTYGNKQYFPYHFAFCRSDQDIVHGYWEKTGLNRYHSVRCIKDE